MLIEYNNDIQFYFVGDGPKKSEYLTLVSSLGLDENVFFIGKVNNVEEYLKASNLSVLMSTNAEGFPNAVLESIACGIPVIATNTGGTKELLINDEHGYLISPGDHEMLTRKIRYLSEYK